MTCGERENETKIKRIQVNTRLLRNSCLAGQPDCAFLARPLDLERRQVQTRQVENLGEVTVEHLRHAVDLWRY